MTSFNLNPAYFAAVATAAVGTEESRPYLQGVYVTPHVDPETGKGALMVCTDGHRLATFYDRDGHAPRAAILAMDWKSKALKAARTDVNPRLIIDVDAKQARREDGDTVLAMDTVREINDTFPDFWRVLPAPTTKDKTPVGTVCYNVEHLMSFVKAARALCEKLGWAGQYVGGSSHDCRGWHWINTASHESFGVATR